MYQPRTRSNTTPAWERRRTTPEQQGGWGNPPSPSRSFLGGAIMVRSTVSSLSAEIGALNFQWLTTANVTGDRQTSVSLTFRIPRGPWLRINRYQQVLRKSPSRSGPDIKLVLMPPNHRLVHRYGATWEVIQDKRPWWGFFQTQG